MRDLIGQKFDRLIIVKRIDNDKWGHSMWLCLCDCGIKTIVQGNHLENGSTKSCGCLQKELLSRKTKHGHNRSGKESRTYRVWGDMIQRCTNPNRKGYKNYGGRDITICRRWLKFENFLEDMGEVPKELQLDRIDNNKGYYKSNCNWVTSKQNNRNKRNNHLIINDGKTQCIIAWTEELGIKIKTLDSRINKLGWSIEKALTTPVRKIKQRR